MYKKKYHDKPPLLPGRVHVSRTTDKMSIKAVITQADLT
jgi:hypothetical protein